MAALTIDDVNRLDHDEFVARLGFLFEASPWVAANTWQTRPFKDVDQLHAALCRSMLDASQEQQVALIRAHPELAGKAAVAGELTPESTREQASASLDRLTPEQLGSLTWFNREYRERFGFPFVICVREHTTAGILTSITTRLRHTREQELATALAEIGKIARLRLADVVASRGDS
jgi:2-oxo-4-hydroxy-4-carboxy-5-ureidoimidazoline decarboxylase